MTGELSRSIDGREIKIAGQRDLAVSSREQDAQLRELSSPLIHIPLYRAHDTSDHDLQYLIELLLACLDSYFAHENTYDLLVTTNDERPLEVLTAYKEKSRQRFELRLVSPYDLLSTFRTDWSHLMDVPCMKTIFSKFYPILKQESDAIVHVDFDTMFLSKIDLRPLLVSDIGLVDANQFARAELWCPTAVQADFFRIGQPVKPVSSWVNSGVFSVQRGGVEVCRTEIAHYLENLERAIADGFDVYPDELIMNALAVRRTDAVTVIRDYRYNFLAYYLKHDPSWTWRGKIVHFHSLKPYMYWYSDGAVEPRCSATDAERLNEDLYLAVLMWCRHLHAACRQLAYDFPMLSAMPLEVVEKELARLGAERNAASETRTLSIS
jgi:hypothetical protein